jgi:hypothetical protein
MRSGLRLSILLLGIISLSFFSSNAQNLDEIGLSKGVKINGSVNLNTIGYYASGIRQRRDPFNWFLTGSLNVNLFGYSAPLSFSYSNANKSFSQPFNQFSFAPSYKWVKTYIGYNSMTFSNYTLAGHVFLGGGVDLTPGKWRISAMYGRLRKAVPFNVSDTLQYTNASYKRMGYGLKVGYEDEGNAIGVSVFTAKDDINSVPFVLPESQLTPQQNIALSINGRKKFLKRFFVDAEYAISALNKDIRADEAQEDTVVFKPTNNIVKGLLPENSTSRYFDALNASIGYQGNWYTIQFKYERIAPEYQTLGAYYFNNDMRNITIAPLVRLFNNKLNLAANAGIQQNNLDNVKASTTKRTVASFNVNYLPNEKWNLAATYSNFSTFTNVKPQPDPFFQNKLDTLNYYQVSQTMNGTVIRNLGGQKNPQSIMLNVGYQKANDRATYEGTGQQSDFISMNLSYSYSLVPSNATVALAGNVYSNNAAGVKSTFLGPTLSITKAFLEKKLRGSWASSYNETLGNNINVSPVLNNRLSLNFSPKPADAESNAQHTFSLGINLLNRLKSTGQQPAFTEFTATLNYSYSF